MSPPARRAVLIVLALVVLAGGHLRLQSAIHTVVEAPLRSDAGQYFRYAGNLLAHGVYSRAPVAATPPAPDAVRSPGYPVFLLPFLATEAREGTVLLRIHVAQAVLGMLSIALAFLAARAVCGTGPALAVAALVALSPHLVVAGSYVLSETLFAFLLVAALALAGRYAAAPGPGLALAAGLLIGAAALTRPWLQYFVPVVLLWAWLAPARPLRAAHAALLAAGFLVAFAPWVARNVATLGTTSDPHLTINGLHHGMYPDFTYAGDPRTRGYAYRFDPASEAVSRSVGTTLAAIADRFATSPAEHLRWYLLDKPVTLFGWSTIQGAGDVFVYRPLASPYFSDPPFRASRAVMKALHVPLMVLAAAGAVLAWLPGTRARHGEAAAFAARFCALLYLYFVAVHIVTAPYPRYAIPVRPLSFLLAVFALVWSWHAVRRSRAAT